MKAQYISELLYDHECVIVPSFGGFLTSYLSARISKESNRFFPPSCNIAFNASLSTNDGLLASYIVKQSGISYREAVDEIRKWVEESLKILNSGNKLEFEDIGSIELDPEGNLQFKPGLKLNFLGNSYGLPSFVAQPVLRSLQPAISNQHPRVQPWPSKLRYIVPATLKWAAVLAPFMAFTLWGSMNTGTIENYIQNYSGLFSWVRNIPGKTSTSIPDQTAPDAVISGFEISVPSPEGIMNDKQIEYAPGIVSYMALKNNGLIDPVVKEAEVKVTNSISAQYFIIGGAFREHLNALKMLDKLKSQGYPAAIIDTTAGGLYVVSIKGFELKKNAIDELFSVKEAGYSSAWIMKKS